MECVNKIFEVKDEVFLASALQTICQIFYFAFSAIVSRQHETTSHKSHDRLREQRSYT